MEAGCLMFSKKEEVLSPLLPTISIFSIIFLAESFVNLFAYGLLAGSAIIRRHSNYTPVLS